MRSTLTQKISEDPTLFAKLLPGLLAASFIPLLLIIQFDLADALFYPLAALSILSSILVGYFGGIVIRARGKQNRVR